MTDRYAVIGNPVSHSQSPRIHTEFARQTGQDLNYEKLLAPVDRFADIVQKFRWQGGRGASITIPFKRAAWQLATQHSSRAQIAQAVNTLDFSGDKIIGDNTDGTGFIRDLQQNLNYTIKNKRVLVMGAGGAACGLLFSVLSEKPTSVVVANRDTKKAIALLQRFRLLGNIDCSSYADLTGKQFDLVINATATSLYGELPPLPSGVFAKGAMAYDMMYGGQSKPFLDFASQQGAACGADGLGMLVEQAAESFSIWRRVWPNTAPIIELLRAAP